MDRVPCLKDEREILQMDSLMMKSITIKDEGADNGVDSNVVAVKVWDWPTRLLHWINALLIISLIN